MIDGGLRAMFRKQISDAMWTSIESGFTSQGIPDAEYCFEGGRSGWVEFKKTDSARGKVPHMRPEQIAWLERRRRLGGRAFVALRVTTKAVDSLYLIEGLSARFLKTDGIIGIAEHKIFFAGDGGSAKWDWDLIRSALSA